MAKYDPLARFLRSTGEQELDVSTDAIADMVDGGLPPSAYDRSRTMRWSNTADAGHVQAAAGWLAAGYVVTDVDYRQRKVRFSLRQHRRERGKRTPTGVKRSRLHLCRLGFNVKRPATQLRSQPSTRV